MIHMRSAIEPVGEAYARQLWQTYRDHAADPRTRRCRRCWRPNCTPWTRARGELALAGLISWDPLRARHLAAAA